MTSVCRVVLILTVFGSVVDCFKKFSFVLWGSFSSYKDVTFCFVWCCKDGRDVILEQGWNFPAQLFSDMAVSGTLLQDVRDNFATRAKMYVTTLLQGVRDNFFYSPIHHKTELWEYPLLFLVKSLKKYSYRAAI